MERKGRSKGLKGVRINGKWFDDVQEVKQNVRNFFEQQFASSQTKYSSLPAALMGRKIEPGTAVDLELPFSEDEIKKAIWSCGLEKSPGPDGFNFHFFWAFWDVMKTDLVALFNDFHANAKLVRGLNSSFITLILKCEARLQLRSFVRFLLLGVFIR